jgi:Bacterial membrane protein YfhO
MSTTRALTAVPDIPPAQLAQGERAPGVPRRAPRWPWLLVAAAVAWNLVSLRAETLGVSYLDDSSVHEQMVRFAGQLIRAGQLPLTSWFPFLGLGSPQFLHYQSLPSMVTGLLGIAVGGDAAFRWTMYLLLSLWPVSVYLSARLFGAGRPAAAASAAMSPFVMSVTGIGYEQKAYLWIGFGVWTQLWASLTLPLAWGFSWRAIRHGRNYFAAVALVALTIALHFETGYLALVPLLLWPFVAGVPLRRGAARAALVIAGSLLASAWVIVPLIEQRAWAATNQVLRGTGLVNGYGAGRVLGWLGSGQLLDHGRLPILTFFAAVGLALAVARWRSDPRGRAVVVVLAACLLLSFGRTTFGSLVDLIPGSGDIFFRRFMMGIQLAALLLAGGGAAWCARAIWERLERSARRRGLPTMTGSERFIGAALALVAVIVVLAPAWSELGSYDAHNSSAIAAQRRADRTQGAELDQLIALIQEDGGGRVYAGMPSNWGEDFTVGQVPVFKYLESRDVDEVGYTLRTASLMTDPEYHFDEHNPGDYRLFGIHYLIVPTGYAPPVSATMIMRVGPYALWTVSAGGYVHVGTIVGTLAADRSDVGTRSIPLLRSRLPQSGDYLSVAFGHAGSGSRPLPAATRSALTGAVLSEIDNLDRGEVTTTVDMRRAGVVILSASFDPGWHATVDGHPQPTQMVAPALVAAHVPAGVHRIVFKYQGYRGYPELFALAVLTLALFLVVDLRPGRPRSARRRRTAPVA